MSDKPEIDIQRLEHLEEIRAREHASTLRLFEVYRERLQDRGDARTALAEIERLIAEQPHSRANDPEWKARREHAAAKLTEADRRLADADRARNEADERFQTAGGLLARCTEWCRENKIQVPA